MLLLSVLLFPEKMGCWSSLGELLVPIRFLTTDSSKADVANSKPTTDARCGAETDPMLGSQEHFFTSIRMDV